VWVHHHHEFVISCECLSLALALAASFTAILLCGGFWSIVGISLLIWFRDLYVKGSALWKIGIGLGTSLLLEPKPDHG
jgi:hypothetical protein